MNTIKKLLAMVVASVMLVGIVPAGVLAQPEQLASTEQAAAQAQAEAVARQAAYEEAAKQAAENAAKQAQQQQAQINQQQQAQQSQSWKQVDQAAPQQAQQNASNAPAEQNKEEESKDKTEEKYPERTLADVSLGNGATLSVFAPEGALKENAEVKVTASDAAATKALLEGMVDGELTETKQYQISFVEDGKVVSPKKDVKLTFKGVTMYGEKAALYRIDGSAAKLDGPADVANGASVTLTANAAKPGTYAIAASRAPQQAEEEQEQADEEADEDPQAEPTETPAATDGLSDEDKAAVADALRSILSLTAVPVSEEAAAAAAAEETKEDAAEEAKVNYPAFETSQAVAGTSMTVRVSAPEGAFPEGINLSATAVSTPADVLAAIKADNGEVANDDIVSVDVHFYLPDNSGAEIEPKVPVNVTFSNIGIEAETVDVYHEADKIAEIPANGATLALDSFSTYTFIANDGVVNKGETDDGEVTVTVPNQTIVLGAPSIAIADITSTKNNTTGATPAFDPDYWDAPTVDGNSVTVSNFVITPVALGKSTITMSRKAVDQYWIDHPLKVTFTVNVVEDNTVTNNDGTVTVTIPDQNIKLDVDESGTAIAIADITTTKNNTSGATFPFDPSVWETPTVDGDSVTVDNFVITPVKLGESTITMSRKALDQYWIDNPITITFKVNVTTDLSYQGNGQDIGGGENYIKVYNSDPATLDANPFTKKGYKFLGWAKDDSATTPDFQPGEDILTNDIYGSTVYAVWEEITRKPVIINVDRVWDDDDNRDGLRSRTDYIVTASLPDGTVLYERTDRSIASNDNGTKTVSQGDGGTAEKFYTMTEDGQEITYTITATHRDKTAGDYTVTAVNDSETDDGTNVIKHFTITNTHAPEKYGPISVTKVWDDDNNRDGKRADILVQIKRDRETVRQSSISDGTKVLAESNTDPKKAYYKYHDGGVPYTYTVEERDLPAGYDQVSIEGDVEGGFTITNKHEPETVQIKVNKVWEDNDDQDGKRPEEITLHVVGKVGDEEVASRTVTWPKTKTSSTITKADDLKTPLYKYHNGEEISYTVTEDEVSEYTTAVTGSVADGFTVTNTHEPEKRPLTVKKVWAGENGDTSRRSDVNVTIMADEQPINETLTITGDESTDTWTGTINVDRYHDKGQEYTYTVEEQDVPFYRNDGVTGNMVDGFTLTNTYIPNTTTVTIEKVWKDAKDADDKRPDGVHLLLMNNGKIERESWVRAADNWTVTFTDVPVFVDAAASDKTIDYKVEEENNAGYIVTVAEDEEDAIKGYTYKVTNTMPEAGKIDIPVEKIWKDDNNRDGLRPESLDVTLQTGGEPVATTTLTEENGWKGTFEGVPKMDIETEEPIEYTVAEPEIDGYTAAITGDAETGFTVTNTHTPEVIESIPVTKTWEDEEDLDGIRPEAVYVRLIKPDGTDMGRQRRLNENNNWSDSFKNIQGQSATPPAPPIYKYENGQEIEYTVVESKQASGELVPIDGYEMSVSGKATEGFTITNTHKPNTGTITITKTWDDDNNRDGKRPETLPVTITWTDATGEKSKEVTLTADDNWTATVDELPVFSAKETPFEYTVTEDAAAIEEDYEAVKGEATVTLDEDPDQTVELENKHEPDRVTIDVTKVWDDDGNRDGFRKQVYARLYANGVYKSKQLALGTQDTNTVTFTSSEKTPLYKYENGEEIEYTVVESWKPSGEPVTDDPAGKYTTEITGNATEGFTITNTHEPELIEIPVTKVWDDDDNRDGLRKVVFARLYVGDEYKGKQLALGTEDTNTVTFTSSEKTPLYKYENGTEIEYTVREFNGRGRSAAEEAPEGYEMSVAGNAADGFTITNTHKPKKVDIHVIKEWKDDDNRDGKRPDSLEYTLYANGEEYDSKTVYADTGFEAEWVDLPENDGGEPISYTIVEWDSGEYYPTYETKTTPAVGEEKGEVAITITNTYDPEKRSVMVMKQWEDNNNQDGLRPEEVTMTLQADGEATETTAKLNAANGWAHNFEDLPRFKNEDGKITEIKYSVIETAYTMADEDEKAGVPEGYEASYSDFADTGSITVTNTHKPETFFLTIYKVWDDGNNRDGKRPESVTFDVMGVYAEDMGFHLSQQEVTLHRSSYEYNANEWYNVIEVPTYAAGGEVAYIVTEQVPAGYECEEPVYVISGTSEEPEATFTNTYKPERVSFTVEKVWDDNDNQDGLRRPISININGYVEGKVDPVISRTQYKVSTGRSVKGPIRFSQDDNKEPLYKYYEGKEVTYVVTEDPIPEYSTEVTGNVTTGFTITNTHKPETGSLSVIKEWEDNENQDGFRPDSIQVTLSSNADPDLDADVGLSAANGWTYTWDNLPMYKDGELIEYTVTEVKDGAWVKNYEIDEESAEGITLDEGSDAIITNTHVPETMTIEVDKIWDDESNYDHKRPADGASISVRADGVEVEEGTFNGEADKETLTFADLPVYQDGKKIVYTVTEDSVDGYTSEIITHPMYSDPGEDGQPETDDDFNKQVFQITNTHKPGMTTITAQKVWDDENDQDGKRPESITAKLQFSSPDDPGMEGWFDHPAGTVELNAENSWTASWDVHTQRVETGSDLKFRVIETEVPDGYEVSYAQKGDVWTITNKHVPEKGLIAIEKIWNDDNDRDGMRPDSVTFNILGACLGKDGNVHVADRFDFTINKSTANNEDVWFDVFEVPKYCDGSEILWTANEKAIDGYEPQGDIGTAGGINLVYYKPGADDSINKVENKHEPELVEIPVKKVWNDADNQDGVRPESVRAFVYANGEYAGRQAKLNEGNQWTATIASTEKTKLYKYEGGKEIKYTVVESLSGSAVKPIANYTSEVTGSVEDGFTITNTHKPATASIKVIKQWEDWNNNDGFRPDSLLINVKDNNGNTWSQAVSSANGWQTVFEDLPAYSDGQAIEYTVSETIGAWESYYYTADPETVTLVEEEGEVVDREVTLINWHEPLITDITVTKVWDDNDNQDGKRPDSVNLTLLANNTPIETKTVTAEDDWTWHVGEALRFVNGQLISYTVAEGSVDGYTTDYDYEVIEPTSDDEVYKTNFIVTNKDEPEMTTITVVKEWDDEDNYDGLRPEEVQFTLTGKTETNPSAEKITDFLNEGNVWTFTADVPVKHDGENIEYTVEETGYKMKSSDETVTEGVPAGYKASYSDKAKKGYFTITNTHEVERTEHTVKIEWDDNNNQDGNRPEYVNVSLRKTVGEGEPELVGEPVTLTAANGWTYTWKELPKKDYSTGEAVEIKYDAVQVGPIYSSEGSGVSGASVSTHANGGGAYDESQRDTSEDGSTTTIVNTYTPKTIDIAGKKIWEDNSNQDGVRPASIKVNLYADGDLVETKEVTAETADPTNADVWNYEFKGVPRYIDGRLVHYQVLEEAIPNYTPRVVGYDIYNTYTPGKTFTTVIKLWDDDQDRDGLRPDNVIVRLLANGEEVNRASISLASGWFTIWTDLDVNSGGKPIEYSVTEDAVEGYTSEITGDAKTGFTVKNTHTSERVDVTVKKVWKDDNDKKKLRPQSITVNLLVNGVKVDTHTLTEADGWKTTFKDMPKNANGLPISYVIAEDEVPGYYATVSGDTITNTLNELCPSFCPPARAGSGSSGITAVKTGDASSIALMIFLLLVGALAITQAVVSRKRTGR